MCCNFCNIDKKTKTAKDVLNKKILVASIATSALQFLQVRKKKYIYITDLIKC